MYLREEAPRPAMWGCGGRLPYITGGLQSVDKAPYSCLFPQSSPSSLPSSHSFHPLISITVIDTMFTKVVSFVFLALPFIAQCMCSTPWLNFTLFNARYSRYRSQLQQDICCKGRGHLRQH